MNLRGLLGKFFLSFVLWTFLLSGLPVKAQNNLVTSSDISGGMSVFVWRNSGKANKNISAPRRRSKARRTASQKRVTRRKVVSETRQVARKNRSRRTINKVSPEEFEKVQIKLKEQPPKEASEVFLGAAEYFIEEESDLQKAAEYLEEALTLDPTNQDAKLAFSELSVTIGNEALDDMSLSPDLRNKKALGYFEQAAKYDPKNALAFVGLGQVYEDTDEAKAKTNYEMALKLDPTLAEAKAALGFLYYTEGRTDDADKLISEALAEGEESAEIQYFNGLVKYKKGDSDEAAIKALRRSIALDTENAEAHYYLGVVLNRNNQSKDAIKSFEEAVRLDPKFVNAWFDLGVAYYNAERYQDAIKAFDRSVADNTNGTDELRRIYAESFANIAETYRQLRDNEKAITNYRTAVSLITDDAELFTAFGFVLGAKGSWKDAVTNFENAVRVQPDAVNYANLGWAYIRSAEDNRSLSYFDREKADIEKASAALATALQKDPTNLAANFNMGVVMNDLGRSDEAIEALKRALKADDKFMPAIYELGEAYFTKGDYSKAAEQYRESVKIDDKFVFGYFNLGKSEHMRGNKKEANKALDKLKKLDPKLAVDLSAFFSVNRR